MITRVCLYCKNEFLTWEARIRQGKGKFCSQQCSARYHIQQGDGGSVQLYKIGHPQFNTGRTHFTTERLKGKKLSAEHIEKVRAAHIGVKRPERSGPNCHLWRGGITGKNHKLRTSIEFINWRREVFEKDDYTCQICDKRGGKLHAHHIKMFSKYPSLRFEPSNGVTLCPKCHQIADEISRITHVLSGGEL